MIKKLLFIFLMFVSSISYAFKDSNGIEMVRVGEVMSPAKKVCTDRVKLMADYWRTGGRFNGVITPRNNTCNDLVCGAINHSRPAESVCAASCPSGTFRTNETFLSDYDGCYKTVDTLKKECVKLDLTDNSPDVPVAPGKMSVCSGGCEVKFDVCYENSQGRFCGGAAWQTGEICNVPKKDEHLGGDSGDDVPNGGGTGGGGTGGGGTGGGGTGGGGTGGGGTGGGGTSGGGTSGGGTSGGGTSGGGTGGGGTSGGGTSGGGTSGGGTSGGGTSGGGTSGGGTSGGGTSGGGTSGGGTGGGGTGGGGTGGGGTGGGGTGGGGTGGGGTGGGGTGGSGTGGEGDGNSWGGSCKSGFVCTGDAIACAVSRAEYERNCFMFENPKDSNEYKTYQKAALDGDKAGINTAKEVTKEVIISSSMFNQSSALGNGSCIKDLTISFQGQTITLPLSQICPYFQIMGTILVSISFLVATFIVFRGL